MAVIIITIDIITLDMYTPIAILATITMTTTTIQDTIDIIAITIMDTMADLQFDSALGFKFF